MYKCTTTNTKFDTIFLGTLKLTTHICYLQSKVAAFQKYFKVSYKEVSKNGCSSSIIDILVESVTLPLLRLLRFGELFALVVSVLLKVIKSSSAPELSFWPLLDFSRLTLH